MSRWYKKSNLAIGLFLGISLYALGCLGTFVLAEKFEGSVGQAPIRSLTITIDPSQQDKFFDQLRKFADKHSFEYNLTNYGGQGKHFLVYMLGEDVKILTVGISDNSNVFSVRFYAPSPGDPSPDKEIVDSLVIDLKMFINEIPNVTITEEE